MTAFHSNDYLERMIPWLNVLPKFLRQNANGTWYGTGESAHWPVQSNMNVCAALAVMAADPDFEKFSPVLSREEVREYALALFRYAMKTHRTGCIPATDGKSWGHHWISVLGAERMTHGVNALQPCLTDEDRERYRNFRISESDWLLEEYPVVASMVAGTGQNKPESNIWNGGFLLRTAMDYPDLPRREEYLEKAASFLLNGISHPLDAASERLFRGKPLREWHVGFNFTPNYSLDHHGYLNVGYMVICLSNLAMLHFNFKELGQEAPPELYLHAEDLWKVVKHFIFPDGRLLRIGGDTRARYTYCQCYAIPMWLMAADVFHDRDAARFEQNWLNIVRREMDDNGDGACYTRRLDKLGKISYYYFCRLESDHILSLSYGAYWRRKFTLPQPAELPDRKPAVWEDDFHDAAMIRTGSTVRSWVKAGAQGPTGLCVPLNRSDMAEWQGNLNGVLTGNNIAADFRKGEQKTFPGGFFYTGSAGLVERLPMGEGEERYLIAEHQSASAALPDGKTLLVAERCVMKKEATLHRVLSLNLELPNDVFNGFRRHFRSEEFDAVLTMPEGKGEVIDTRSRALNIDNCLTVRLLSGGESLKIVRSADRNICLRKDTPPEMDSLYADLIAATVETGSRRWMPGEILFDVVFAVSADTTFDAMPRLDGSVISDGLRRTIRFTGADGVPYRCHVLYKEDGSLPEIAFDNDGFL